MLRYNITKKRRGISGLMQVAMIVGIVVIFAGALFVFASEIFTVQTTTNSIAMQRAHVYDVDGEAYVSVNVKNVGNNSVENTTLKVLIDTDPDTDDLDAFEIKILPLRLEPGMSGSAYSKITYTDGDPVSVQSGQEIATVLETVSSDGSVVSEPVVIRVR